MKTLYIECKMGAAGDMLMAALYELVEEKEAFLAAMNRIFGEDIHIMPEQGTSCGIGGTHMHVEVLHTTEAPYPDAVHTSHTPESTLHSHASHSSGDAPHHHTPHGHYSYTSILDKLDTLPIPEDVRTNAKQIYRLLGEAEATVHNTTLEQIHFHEVGSMDALCDIVGCCLLIDYLKPEQILASPIHVGNGTVCCAHGTLPVPAPATAELLKGIPYYTGDIQTELCTPTGAAIIKYFAASYGNMPILSIDAIGTGLGTKELQTANCVRIFCGNAEEGEQDQILDLSCNLDDMTGEALGYAMELLLDEGALDVYYESIHMKKNRPGTLLHCLCPISEREKFQRLIFSHTTTRGIRIQRFSRAKLDVHMEEIQTDYGIVWRKISQGYGITHVKYEYDDIKRIAKKYRLPLKEVVELVESCLEDQK